MTDNPDLVDKYEDKLFVLVRQMLDEGVDPEAARFLLQEERKNIKLAAYCRAWLDWHGPERPEKPPDSLAPVS